MKDFKFTKEERDSIEDFALDQVLERNFGGIENVTDYIESLIQARADADGWVKVEVLQDESSHWYVIPCSLRSEWDAHEQKIQNCDEYSDEWYEAIAAFSAKFSAYMTGGNINDTQLYIQLPPKQ